MKEFVDSIRALARVEKSATNGGVRSNFFSGTWISQESVDPDLSQVRIEGDSGGTVVRGVRKLQHVTGLISGVQVLMVKDGTTPLTIIGRLVGDITKVEVG